MVLFSGCNAIITKKNGTVHSPAFGSSDYPLNQECVIRIRDPEGGRLSMMFTDMDVHPTDLVQVRNAQCKMETYLWPYLLSKFLTKF